MKIIEENEINSIKKMANYICCCNDYCLAIKKNSL